MSEKFEWINCSFIISDSFCHSDYINIGMSDMRTAFRAYNFEICSHMGHCERNKKII